MAAIRGPIPGARTRARVAAHAPAAARGRVAHPFGSINWWVLGGIIIVGLSALLPVIQSSMVTSEGFSMQRSQEQVANLNGQISILESEIGQMTSIGRIEQRAQEIGLQPPLADPTFIHVNVPGPAPAKIPASYLPAPATTQEHPQSWWQSLFDWLPLPH
ncbi:hypothetical protein J0H33_04435 [bacterium]|nr:hypothetical protein [bacterium]